uniref:Uncharacterized protein n=1 Tax=Vitrella brassicaformis TaxID=1169539 RepID=A0A7S1KIL8_9ALVE|mmetsp:Transcript_16222/g.46186  ORF Transcript_16222/g.46186 Transcript_16222/m.46186 type:complete len:108 (+) Transcript_16222:332-655(+)
MREGELTHTSMQETSLSTHTGGRPSLRHRKTSLVCITRGRQIKPPHRFLQIVSRQVVMDKADKPHTTREEPLAAARQPQRHSLLGQRRAPMATHTHTRTRAHGRSYD